ncbi:hypothetical protein KEH56_36605 [Burkholderia cenocepacia]|uniref:phage adaptor protein n=1 Tax=Burkholderia cenocepacia TaxID=95486 RepID=UPI001BA691DA|nr:DUF6682 family protein [Burkholderia cenocepacia]QUN44694.1 hypothetical protein KEH56_36605 [Burkholderia cenocepacia]
MTTVRSLVDEVSALLNDAEPEFANIRWTRDEVREYAADAALQVATLRPELFEHTETLILSPGERQTLPDGTMFERIDGTLNDKGELMGRPYRADATVSRVASRWFGDWSSRCACCATTHLRAGIVDLRPGRTVDVLRGTARSARQAGTGIGRAVPRASRRLMRTTRSRSIRVSTTR